MGRRRLLLVLVPVAACAALLLLLRERGAGPRALPRRGLLAGEELRDVPQATAAAPAAPEPEPVFLKGRVLSPEGTPLAKGEVRVVFPKTYVLVRAAASGEYELPLPRGAGRYLVEAALTTEYAPARAWIAVPEAGDPKPHDFRLEPAGAIFGEVTAGGMPVVDAGVELFALDGPGDPKPVHDTSARNGYFNFFFPPPKDVPLRLEVNSAEGILRTPVAFRYLGEPVNLGRIELTPYPALRIRMRLPDGRYAPEVCTCRREDLKIGFLDDVYLPARHLGTGSLVVVQQEGDVSLRLVFAGTARTAPTGEEERSPEERPPCMVEREVRLTFGQPRELDVVVRPGPLVVAGRLADGRGRPVRARLRCAGSEVATAQDGSFQIVVPHGGLHTIWLAALDAPGWGWVDLGPGNPDHALLLDADDPARETRLDLDRRVLVLATPPLFLYFDTDKPARVGDDEQWLLTLEDPGPTAAFLTKRLAAGTYVWARESPGGARAKGTVTVEANALAIVDAR
jgi:hypothetical protein